MTPEERKTHGRLTRAIKRSLKKFENQSLSQSLVDEMQKRMIRILFHATKLGWIEHPLDGLMRPLIGKK